MLRIMAFLKEEKDTAIVPEYELLTSFSIEQGALFFLPRSEQLVLVQ